MAEFNRSAFTLDHHGNMAVLYSLILDFPDFSELSKMEKIVSKDLMEIPKLLWPMSAIKKTAKR
jgi:hypothetical protein